MTTIRDELFYGVLAINERQVLESDDQLRLCGCLNRTKARYRAMCGEP